MTMRQIWWVPMALGVAIFLYCVLIARSHRDPCVDTVEIISTMPGNPNVASCAPGMTMELENRVQGAMVKCHCPKVDR